MGLRHLALFAVLPFVIFQIFRRPHFGVYVFCALTLVRIHELAWGFEQLRLLLVISVVTLVAYAMKPQEYEGLAARESPPILFFGAFLGLAALSAVLAQSAGGVAVASLKVEKLAKMLLFMFLMLKMLDDVPKSRAFVLIWIAGTTFLAVWGAEQHFRGNERLERVGGGDTNGSNELGALFVLVLPVVLELGFAEEKRLLKGGLLALVPLYVAVIAFTGSRSAFLGLVVAAGVLLLRSPNRGKLVKTGLSLAPLVVVLSVAYFAQRVETIETYEQDWSAMSRLWFWQAALNMTAANPALGVGPGNYPLVAHEYGSPEVGRDCHSTYFTMLSEVGPVGFAIWVAGVIVGLVALDRLRRTPGDYPHVRTARALAMGLEAGTIAFLVDGAFHSFGYFEYLYWPLVLGQALSFHVRRIRGAGVGTEDGEVRVEAALSRGRRLLRAANGK